MNMLQIIKDLHNFSPRQGDREIEAAKYIEKEIKTYTSKIFTQKFVTRIPQVTSANLILDGQDIPCLGCSFESGQIITKDQVVSNLHSDYISTPNYYQTPTVSTSRQNIPLLKKAKTIEGRVIVEKFSYVSRNFLVGNLTNPTNVVFTHYDSLGGGSIDNAGSLAVLTQLIFQEASLLENNLFVFAGNEELSYDWPIYWGFGYRQFENGFDHLLRKADQILVIDGVGLTKPEIISDNLDDFLPLKNLSEYISKVKAVSSNQAEILKCYHCKQDTPDKLSIPILKEVSNTLVKMLK